jgi:hypothetical protein
MAVRGIKLNYVKQVLAVKPEIINENPELLEKHPSLVQSHSHLIKSHPLKSDEPETETQKVTDAKKAAPKDNNEIRDSYNQRMAEEWNKFCIIAKGIHKKQQCIGDSIAQEASALREKIKHEEQNNTSKLGQKIIDERQKKKYGEGNIYDKFIKDGKTPEAIAYSSFKTDGRDMGLSNNGIGEIIDIAKILQKKGIEIYPEDLTPKALEVLTDKHSFELYSGPLATFWKYWSGFTSLGKSKEYNMETLSAKDYEARILENLEESIKYMDINPLQDALYN